MGNEWCVIFGNCIDGSCCSWGILLASSVVIDDL